MLKGLQWEATHKSFLVELRPFQWWDKSWLLQYTHAHSCTHTHTHTHSNQRFTSLVVRNNNTVLDLQEGLLLEKMTQLYRGRLLYFRSAPSPLNLPGLDMDRREVHLMTMRLEEEDWFYGRRKCFFKTDA